MRWKSLLVIGLLLVAIAAGLGFYWPFGGKTKVLTLPGLVEIHEVRLGPRVAGRVKEVLVTEGQSVDRGQVLVKLDVPELVAQRQVLLSRIKQMEAEVLKAENGARKEEIQAAKAAVDAATAKWQRLVKGFRDEEKEQAKSDHAAARADRQLAEEEFGRVSRLARSKVGTQADLDTAKAALLRTRGREAAALAKWNLMKAGSRPEDIKEAKAEMERHQAQHRLLLAGTRYEDKAACKARLAEEKGRLAELDVQIKEASIVAHEPCVVELVHVRKGDLAPALTPVVKVLRTGDLWVKTYVPETDLGKVRLGMKVQVSVDSYPNRLFAGKVVHIGAESEFTPRNVQTVDERRHQMFGIRVKIDDPRGVFKSGMAAEVHIPLED